MTAENITATLPYDIQHAPAGCDMIAPGLANGKLRATYFYWTDQLEANSTIKLCTLPPGASVVGLLIRYAAFGAAVTAMLGDAADTDRYIATGGITSMNSAGAQFVPSKTGDVSATAGAITAGAYGAGYRTPAETTLLLTLEAANMATSDHRMDGWVLFTVE